MLTVISKGDIHKLRRSLGYTQQRVAEIAGVSRAAIGHLETGVTTQVHPRTAAGIARALGVPVSRLFRMPG